MKLQDVPGSRYVTVPFRHAAADATQSVPIWTCEPAKGAVLEEVAVCYGTAVTGDDTNTTNINLIQRASTYVVTAESELANKDFETGTDAAVDTREVLFSTETAFTQGQILCVDFEHVGTGVALGFLGFQIKWRPEA